jgi:hypothetical protein
VTFTLCIALLILAFVGPLDHQTGTASIARAAAWAVGMLGIALALVVIRMGWPS